MISGQLAVHQAGTGLPANGTEMQRSTCRTEILQDYTAHHHTGTHCLNYNAPLYQYFTCFSSLRDAS